jgi:hypothetical protein
MTGFGLPQKRGHDISCRTISVEFRSESIVLTQGTLRPATASGPFKCSAFMSQPRIGSRIAARNSLYPESLQAFPLKNRGSAPKVVPLVTTW